MKRLALLLAVSVSFNPLFAVAQVVVSSADAVADSSASTSTTEIIVKYKNSDDIQVVEATSPSAVADTINSIESNPSVDYAEPNFSRSIFTLPNDTHVGLQWSLSTMQLPSAWDISTGTPVTVGVIDVGIDYDHPDLANVMWNGTSCLDDTGASVPGGCVHGYDFYSSNSGSDTDPMMPLDPANTDAFHGTHVAGIIGAEYNNGTGITGLAPHAKIMAIKFGLDVLSEVRAINFATKNGVKIINASYGGTDFSQDEYNAIKSFTDAGGLFIAAAGNNGDGASYQTGQSDEQLPIYPASYDLPGIISVAATDSNDNLAVFSNYGPVSVDVAAPGVTILSTYSSSTAAGVTEAYAYASGTSMAAPEVAGLVALVWGTSPSLTASQVKDLILNTGDSLPSLSGKTVTGKRVDALSALQALEAAPTATLSGTPDATSTDALPKLDVSVSGAGITQYLYKLDGGVWSATTTSATHITASGLTNGAHTLSVIGGNTLGTWQTVASSTDYSWIVADATAPEISGLSDDTSGVQSKTWSWSSPDPTASFRYEVSTSAVPLALASSTYSGTTSTVVDSPLGTLYLHIQSKDNNGNESAVQTYSVLLAAPAPAPSGGGGGGGSGEPSPSPDPAVADNSTGDENGDGTVDILDFNTLMIHWSDKTDPILEFNSLMVHWSL